MKRKLTDLIPKDVLDSVLFSYRIMRKYPPKEDDFSWMDVKAFYDGIYKGEHARGLTEQGKERVFRAYMYNLRIWDDPCSTSVSETERDGNLKEDRAQRAAQMVSLLWTMFAKRKEGHPADIALNVTLSAIVAYLVEKSGKPHHNLVSKYFKGAVEGLDDLDADSVKYRVNNGSHGYAWVYGFYSFAGMFVNRLYSEGDRVENLSLLETKELFCNMVLSDLNKWRVSEYETM